MSVQSYDLKIQFSGTNQKVVLKRQKAKKRFFGQCEISPNPPEIGHQIFLPIFSFLTDLIRTQRITFDFCALLAAGSVKMSQVLQLLSKKGHFL